jgi:archaellin
VNDVSWDKAFVGSNNSNDLLEAGELAEITVDLASLSPALGPNTEFTIEVKPPAGAVLNISRTTPAAIGDVLELK